MCILCKREAGSHSVQTFFLEGGECYGIPFNCALVKVILAVKFLPLQLQLEPSTTQRQSFRTGGEGDKEQERRHAHLS